MYQCRNCGSGLTYEIASGKLHCSRCDSRFTPAEVEDQTVRHGENGMQGYCYTCPNCGGSLFTVDTTATTFCSFCGSSVLLEEKLASEMAPDMIIPFRVTREEGLEKYRQWTRGVFCASREMRTAPAESFRAIYMPYVNYETRFSGPLTGKTTQVSGNYQYTYQVSGDISCEDRWFLRDLSQALPDDHSQAISDYAEKDAIPFSPPYLAGLNADVPDVHPDTYAQEARRNTAVEATEALYKNGDGSPDGSEKVKTAESAMNRTQITGRKQVLLPVWFMALRMKDRVCYAMVNGATGTVSADLPVNIPRFLLYILALAVPIFLLLNLVLGWTMKPEVTMVIGTLAMAVMTWLTRSQFNRQIEREGEQERLRQETSRLKEADPTEAVSREEDSRKLRKAVGGGGWKTVAGMLPLIIVAVVWVFLNSGMNVGGVVSALSGLLSTIPFLIFFTLGTAVGAFWGTRRKYAAVIAGLVLCVAACVMSFAGIHTDEPFYAAGVALLLCSLWAALEMIRAFNRSCSNPIPVFETHRGGEEDA